MRVLVKIIFKNPVVKNILSAIAVALFGFILLNLAFMFDFLIQSSIKGLIELFTPVNFETNFQWLPPAMHGLFMTIIGIISWLVFRSKLGTLYKAIYMTVPLAVVFVTLGMFLGQWPLFAYLLGSLFSASVLYYFYRTKQPWIYYYTLLLISLVMLLVGLLGVEI